METDNEAIVFTSTDETPDVTYETSHPSTGISEHASQDLVGGEIQEIQGLVEINDAAALPTNVQPLYNTTISDSKDVHIGTKVIQYHQHQHYHSSLEEREESDRCRKIERDESCRKTDFDEKSKKEFERENGDFLKKTYLKNVKKVQVIADEDNTYYFDVTSEHYLPVDILWKEVEGPKIDAQEETDACTSFKEDEDISQPHDMSKDEETKKHTNKQKGKASAKKETVKKSKISKMMTEEKVAKRDSSENIDKFLDNDRHLPIMIEAEAGMGKTVLLHRLALDWANNKPYMKKWKFVFLIPLRQLKNPNEANLEDMICKDLRLLPENQCNSLKIYLKQYREKILFLFDGLDEVDLNQKSEISSFHRDSEYTVVYTSRPMPSNQAMANSLPDHSNLHLKLVGFSEKNTEKFIKLHLKDTKSTAEVFKECKKYLFCNAILKIPLYTSLICLLWKKNFHKLAGTATSLFNTFLRMILQHYQSKENVEISEITFNRSPLEHTVPLNLRHTLKAIAQLAFSTLIDGNLHFTEKEVEDNYLTMEIIAKIGLFCVETAEQNIVYFRHKLFHEYFAGLYLSEFESPRYHLINARFDTLISKGDVFDHSLFFAAGFSVKAYSHIVKCIDEKDKGKDEIRMSIRQFIRKIYPYDHNDILKDTEIQDKNKPETKVYRDAFVMQLIFEAQINADSFPNDFKSLPVWSQSSHSLAAAYYISEVTSHQQKDCEQSVTSLVIIDSADSETNELQCVWEDCRKNHSFTSLSLIHPRSSLINEIFHQPWIYIKDLVLGSTCENVNGPNLRSIIAKMPNIEVVRLSFLPLLLRDPGNHDSEGNTCHKDIGVFFNKETQFACDQEERKQHMLCVIVNFNLGGSPTTNGSSSEIQNDHVCIFSKCHAFFSCISPNIRHVCIHEKRISIQKCLDYCEGLKSICIPIEQANLVEKEKLPKGLEGLGFSTFDAERNHARYYSPDNTEKFDFKRYLPSIDLKFISITMLYQSDHYYDCYCENIAVTVTDVLHQLVEFRASQRELCMVTFKLVGHLTGPVIIELLKYCEVVEGWEVAVHHQLLELEGDRDTQHHKEQSPIRLLYECCEKFHPMIDKGHRCAGSRKTCGRSETKKLLKIVLRKQ